MSFRSLLRGFIKIVCWVVLGCRRSVLFSAFVYEVKESSWSVIVRCCRYLEFCFEEGSVSLVTLVLRFGKFLFSSFRRLAVGAWFIFE